MLPRWVKLVVAVLIVIIGGTVVWWQVQQNQSLVRLDSHSYHVAIMRTNAQLTKGLSGTDSLPSDQAMLFVFPGNAKWQMWMKDMNYPIDMVWLNNNDRVVATVKNAQPSSYNKANPSESVIFTPSQTAHYVIELPGGTIERTGIKNGDLAGLPSNI